MLLADEECEIRKSALELVENLLKGCSPTQLRPFTNSLSACCSLVLSHISWVVRLDGLKLATLLLDHLDESSVSAKIETDVCRLLKGTKRKELRNKLIGILYKILKPESEMSSDDNDKSIQTSSPFSTEVGNLLIESGKPQLFTTQHYSSVQCQKSEALMHIIVPSLEAVWLETVHSNTQITSEQFETLLTTLDLVEILVLRDEEIHGWIQKRLFEQFPHDFRSSAYQSNRLHAKLCRIFITSLSKKSTKKLDKLDVQLQCKTIDFIKDLFQGVQHCDRSVITDLTYCAIKIDSAKVNNANSDIVTFILHNYIASGKLNTLRRIAFQTFLDYQLHSNKFWIYKSMDPQVEVPTNN